MGLEIMVRKKRVSVAMITYNGKEYLKEQIDSILRNLTDTDEMIISDDGSTDGTWEMLEEYQKQDTRISVIKGPRQGVKQCFGALQRRIYFSGRPGRCLDQ